MPVTPIPGDPIPSSGFHMREQAHNAHTHLQAHTQKKMKKINLFLEKENSDTCWQGCDTRKDLSTLLERNKLA